MRKKSMQLVFAANVRRARQQAGITQEALAHLAGLDRTYVGQVERGERNISISNIERLAKALGVDEVELMRRNRAHLVAGP
jgi:transcriptional regulator with XRE-family HTH domain